MPHSLPSVCAPHSTQRSWSPQSTPHTTTQRFAARTTARAAPRYSHPPPDTTWCRPRHVSLTALAPRKPTLAPPHAPPLTLRSFTHHTPPRISNDDGPRSAPALAGGEPVPSKPPAHLARPPNAAQPSRRRLYICQPQLFSPAQVPPQLASASASGTHMPSSLPLTTHAPRA